MNFNTSEDKQLKTSNSSDWFTSTENCSNPDWFTSNETSSILDWITFCFEFQPELTNGIHILLPYGVGSCFIAIITSAILQIKSKLR
jgi:hypothetical protein